MRSFGRFCHHSSQLLSNWLHCLSVTRFSCCEYLNNSGSYFVVGLEYRFLPKVAGDVIRGINAIRLVASLVIDSQTQICRAAVHIHWKSGQPFIYISCGKPIQCFRHFSNTCIFSAFELKNRILIQTLKLFIQTSQQVDRSRENWK